MADRMPNYLIEIKRLRRDVLQTRVNIETNELRVMELHDEARRLEESIEGLRKSLPELETKLAALEKEHTK